MTIRTIPELRADIIDTLVNEGMSRTIAASLAEVVTAPAPAVEREILGNLGLTPEALRESEQPGRYLESSPSQLREMVEASVSDTMHNPAMVTNGQFRPSRFNREDPL